jgi:hypothetical protein
MRPSVGGLFLIQAKAAMLPFGPTEKSSQLKSMSAI